MKNLFITLVFCLVCMVSNAQLEVYTRYTLNGNAEPDINLYGEKKISEKVNMTYFALVEEKWSEALIGLSYSPVKCMSLGLSTGIEHNPAIYRFAGSIWVGKGKNSLLILGEKGKGSDNYWYKSFLSRKLSESLTAGIMAWRFHGIGPKCIFTPKKSDLSFWFLPTYDPEYKVKRLIFGVDVKI